MPLAHLPLKGPFRKLSFRHAANRSMLLIDEGRALFQGGKAGRPQPDKGIIQQNEGCGFAPGKADCSPRQCACNV